MEDSSFEYSSYLVFTVDDQCYAFDVLFVKEVLQDIELVKLPIELPFINGLIKFRDDILPLLDLTKKITSAKHDTTISRYIVTDVTQKGVTQSVAVEVNNVVGVYDIRLIDIKQMPNISDRLKDIVNGLFYIDDKAVTILKTNMLLNEEEIEMLGDLKDERI